MLAAFHFLLFVFTLGHATPITNNWAVIVDTSRYFYNYRHASNSLSFYRTVKRLGIPDNQIILFLADDVACNARNAVPGRLFNDRHARLDLYQNDIEVDFRGEEVTVENFLRCLTGRQSPWTPLSKRLLTDEHSNIFFFLSGHGGDQFLKFQDWEEITASDLDDAFNQMWVQKRYRQILFIVDTCQAATLFAPFTSRNIVSLGSSVKGEDSYAHHDDYDIGVAVIDRFTYYSLQFLEQVQPDSKHSLQEFFDSLSPTLLRSHPGTQVRLDKGTPADIAVNSVFGVGASNTEAQFIRNAPEAFPLRLV